MSGSDTIYSHNPGIQVVVRALVSICERHTTNGIAYVDPDCGDCGSRQEATAIYLLGVIEDAGNALGV